MRTDPLAYILSHSRTTVTSSETADVASLRPINSKSAYHVGVIRPSRAVSRLALAASGLVSSLPRPPSYLALCEHPSAPRCTRQPSGREGERCQADENTEYSI